ncbi:UNVERIFIED_CONTAM: carbon monoxide dehydrogenase subunit G [Williamsia faeni]
MPQKHTCEPVDLTFFDSAPYRFRNSIDIGVTPEQLFEVLKDPDAWHEWLSSITKVNWTSPEPFGIGTTRTVEMGKSMACDEKFLAWEDNRRMTFRFDSASTKSFNAFAEDYAIETTTDGCRMTWTVAINPAGGTRIALAVAKPFLMDLILRRYLKELRKFSESRSAVAE